MVTESGRQPWIAHGILRTADAISPVPAATIASTLALFVLVYGIVFTMGLYYINRLIVKGPQGRAIEPPEMGTRRDGRCRPRPRPAAKRSDTREGDAMEWYLPVIWAALIGTAVAHVRHARRLRSRRRHPVSRSPRSERERDQMMNSVAPFWDGNETWLVLGGGGLWVAFPQAYAVIMPAFYLPVIVMLLALVFRGVAFEFRWVAVTSKTLLELRVRGGLDARRRSARASSSAA